VSNVKLTGEKKNKRTIGDDYSWLLSSSFVEKVLSKMHIVS